VSPSCWPHGGWTSAPPVSEGGADHRYLSCASNGFMMLLLLLLLLWLPQFIKARMLRSCSSRFSSSCRSRRLAAASRAATAAAAKEAL
jgi:hypothetical protein